MDETPVDHPGVPEEVYHTLGKKTLWIFVLEQIHAFIILLVCAVIAFAIEQQSFIKNVGGHDITGYVSLAAWILLGLFILVFGLTFLFTWLMYINYKFALSDNALKIKRGILDKEEISIPYRQIQDVDIDRDLGFQMMGVSRIIILTAGQEAQKTPDNETEGILPALDKDLAEWLQTELLKRANIQKVTEVK